MASQRLSPLSARTLHEIVDATGARVEVLGNKSAATAKMNSWRRTVATDKGIQARLGGRDPNTFSVRPVQRTEA